jgi:Spy/CpxP family protein refolding chaperone
MKAIEARRVTRLTQRLLGRSGVCTFCALLATAAPAIAQEPVSPYAGEEGRAIKALSPDQIADLEAGKGMGFAMAAELNHYPGPRHVLDMADELGLDSDTIARVQAIFDAMQADAVRLGEQLIEAERQLDRAFAERTIDETRLAELTAHAAELQGQLRAVHLAAHIAVTRELTLEQVHAYDAMRGYDGGEAHEHDPSRHQQENGQG